MWGWSLQVILFPAVYVSLVLRGRNTPPTSPIPPSTSHAEQTRMLVLTTLKERISL